jgi:hypothetical protein
MKTVVVFITKRKLIQTEEEDFLQNRNLEDVQIGQIRKIKSKVLVSEILPIRPIIISKTIEINMYWIKTSEMFHNARNLTGHWLYSPS